MECSFSRLKFLACAAKHFLCERVYSNRVSAKIVDKKIAAFVKTPTIMPPLVVATNTVPTASTVALFSGALICLYHQLRKGTLVKIGVGKDLSSIIRNSRHTIQRRVKNNSWFLRNIDSCRRKCIEAVLKIVQPSKDSLENIQVETGSAQAGIVSETTSLPVFTRRYASDIHRHVKHNTDPPPLEKLYSNDSFDSEEYSTQDLRSADTRRDEMRSRRTSHVNTCHRPLTRNFRKSLTQSESCGTGKKLPTKKRKKSVFETNEPEDDRSIGEGQTDERTQISRVASQKVGTEEPWSAAQVTSRRHSDRLRKQSTVQKITRKTRSGRVYVYRL